jgi:hypothetical protein
MPLLRGGICRADTSARGLPFGIEDRIRQRQTAVFVDQQVRPVCPNREFLAALLLVVPSLSWMGKNGGVADRGRASVQRSPAALDAVDHSFYPTLVRLRLGNAIALG